MHLHVLGTDGVGKDRALFVGIAGHGVGHKQQRPEKPVDLGEQLALLHGHRDVVVAKQEHVGIVEERPAVQPPAEDGAKHGLGGADVLARLVRAVRPIERNVGTYAAKVDLAERRHQRHAASYDELVSDAFADEVHRLAHDPAAALAVHRDDARGVEEVEFDQVVAPLAKHDVEELAYVCGGVLVVEVDGIEHAPIWTCRVRLAVLALDEPIGMLLVDERAARRRERREPKPCEHAGFVDLVRRRLHPGRELFAVGVEPLAYARLVPVVDLEDVHLLRHLGKRFEVAFDDRLRDSTVVVVPSCVAALAPDRAALDAHRVEPTVEHLVVRTAQNDSVKHFVSAAEGLALEIFLNADDAGGHVESDDRVALSLAERSEQVVLVPLADIAVRKTVEYARLARIFAPKRLARSAQPRTAHKDALHSPLRKAREGVHMPVDRVLFAVGPGLIAVDETALVCVVCVRDVHPKFVDGHALGGVDRRGQTLAVKDDVDFEPVGRGRSCLIGLAAQVVADEKRCHKFLLWCRVKNMIA